MKIPIDIRFWRHVHKTETCWLWIGAVNSVGYGDFFVQFQHGQRYHTHAHRVAWSIKHKTDAPNGLYILHKCDNRLCVRPSHLYAGTHGDNMRDMIQRRRHAKLRNTHCPSGHVYDQINTRWYKGWRYCKTCIHITNERIAKERRDRKIKT